MKKTGDHRIAQGEVTGNIGTQSDSQSLAFRYEYPPALAFSWFFPATRGVVEIAVGKFAVITTDCVVEPVGVGKHEPRARTHPSFLPKCG
jgi:hypothetical protein